MITPEAPSTREEEKVASGRDRIRRWVENLLFVSNQRSPPVNPYVVAKHRAIVEVSEVSGGPDGLLVPVERGFRVQIKADVPPVRQRSILAHEIAHTFFYDIGQSPPSKAIRWFDRAWSEEGICSEISRQILVPVAMLDTSVQGLSGRRPSIEVLAELADEYEVSLDLIVRRLQDENLCDAIFVFLVGQNNGPLVVQTPMFGCGALRIKGVCKWLATREEFMKTVRRAGFEDLEDQVWHPKLGILNIVSRRINVFPSRVLALATRQSASHPWLRSLKPSRSSR